MLSIHRKLGLIAFMAVIAFILSCGKDKTTQPAGKHVPDAPSNPSPTSQATGININILLSWHCSDPDGDTIKYDVFFDTLSNPGLVAPNQLDSTYQIDGLDFSRDYYWKVAARDVHNNVTASPVWHFSTILGPEQIAFESSRAGGYQIFVINADGSNLRNLADNSGLYDAAPSFSSDGSKIVYCHSYSSFNHVYTMNCRGMGRFEVTHDGMTPGPPVWSPDGTQIAFAAKSDSANYHWAIYIVDAEGTNLHAITDFIIPDEGIKISWSPQGQEIAFALDSLTTSHLAIYTINVDGSNLRQLTSHSKYDVQPTWSHNGSTIVFSRFEADLPYQIYVMNSDGSNQHNITNTHSNEYTPCWSPDDSRIAFHSERDGWPDIYVMNADGSDQHNITNDPADEYYLTWAPYHR
jgi:Tol biopolymer transport system component